MANLTKTPHQNDQNNQSTYSVLKPLHRRCTAARCTLHAACCMLHTCMKPCISMLAWLVVSPRTSWRPLGASPFAGR